MRYRQVFALAIVALGGYGLYHLAGQWSRLSMSLTRSGTNVSPSASMDLHEINLRRMEVDAAGEETGRVLEWKLAVPRAFLIDENGENGSVYSRKLGGGTRYAFTLSMQVSEDLKEFTPRTLVTARGKIPRDILIGSTNSYGSVKGSSTAFITAYDLCVRQSDRAAATSKYNLTRSNINCYDQDYRCSVLSQIDGWSVSATVTRDLYEMPSETCAITKAFLNRYTVKRDKDTSLLKVETP